MRHHLETKHSSENKKLKNTGLQKNNDKIHSYVSRPAEWKPDGKKSIEWQIKILKFLVGTNQPLSVVDNPLFHDLLPAEFVVPSRKIFTNVLSSHIALMPDYTQNIKQTTKEHDNTEHESNSDIDE